MKRIHLNRKILIGVLGLLPLAFGGLFNWLILFSDSSARYLQFYSLGFLVFWGLLAFLVRPWVRSAEEGALLLNLAAAADLLLLGVQEVLLRAYWPGLPGAWSQLFYLPPLSAASTLTSWVGSAFHWSVRMFPTYCVGFGLMLLAGWLGGKLRDPR